MASSLARTVAPGLAALVLLCLAASTAHAAVTRYTTALTGAAMAPPNTSPGTGFATVDVDPVAHTMRVQVTFTGLLGTTTASHIHAPTVVPGVGTTDVATTVPTFAGFPLALHSGSYDHTLDMTSPTSYNDGFLATYLDDTAAAEAALFAAIAGDRAYLVVHSSLYPAGELRGFLQPDNSTPVITPSWGSIKARYRGASGEPTSLLPYVPGTGDWVRAALAAAPSCACERPVREAGRLAGAVSQSSGHTARGRSPQLVAMAHLCPPGAILR